MEILLRTVGALEIILCWLTAPYYFLLRFTKKKYIPPIQNPIILHSASELARKIRMEEYTCEQVVRAFILRCREVNPTLNAIVEERFIKALDEAHSIDQKIYNKELTVEQMEKNTPFLGVPFTVKESIGVKGMSQSVGCLPRHGEKAKMDGSAVQSLKKAGGIPIAVTNTPELCLCWETTNLVTGRTNNPYDLNRTPGGSSGGEAALLSSGASVCSVASDIAGSIRLPAAFTGVFGHKPTPGFVALEGHFPNSDDKNFNKFLTVGPMVRYVEDLLPLFKVMVGDKAPLLRLNEEVDLKKLRIKYLTDLGESMVMIPTDEEIKQAVENAATHFKTKHGCSVEKPRIEELNDTVEISSSVFFQMKGIPDLMTLSDDPKAKKNLLIEFVKSLFGASQFSLPGLIFSVIYKLNGFVPPSKSETYQAMHTSLKKKFLDILGDDGVFILPTHPIPAYYHGQFTMKTAGVGFTMIFNTLEMPATHVPMGLNKDGLPIGVQVVAAPNQDRLCLAVAKELGEKFGGWIPPS
ncbi:fatty-acid amide hydrolase 2-like [Macrosteles quadrilineatus]|uniref:fatty-acid amide hydrolase 2-like n=1 Tax=Macrosteles quadrilineatus TaxID=74068 RepID=UPI0023E24FCD|nr:fatty-acid amide hydrolase 2-like [Macrosteles quadrilineatus]